MSILQEYIIEEKIENPNTGIMMPYIIFGLIILLGVVGYKLIKNKKYL